MVSVDTPFLDPDIVEFYSERRGAFGAMNLLPDHLPGDDRVRELVRNVMTVDYAIGRALAPSYLRYLEQFSATTARPCGTPSRPEAVDITYRDHLTYLTTLDSGRLARALPIAAADTMETFNLFTPKQCNMNCRGCYAAAVSVANHPYDANLTDRYYDGAVSVIKQATQAGARNVYTSGDGEATIFPRFFDLLDEIRRASMQWIFFTAGLIFSSEAAAALAWTDARQFLRGPSRERIARRLDKYHKDGTPDPTVRAFTDELAEFRENVQIYHSIWSTDSTLNTGIRRPVTGNYRYQRVTVRGSEIELPSGLLVMMNEIFVGDLRERLGIEMPVSDIGIDHVPAVAAFVVDNNLRSYFEPTIVSGRNKIGDLGEGRPESLARLSKLLVRMNCGFRNIHQPTIKYYQHHSDGLFMASPGMGVDTSDLHSMGVAGPLTLRRNSNDFFRATHSPLMAYANYVHATGCKCNSFSSVLVRDRQGITEQWRGISAELDYTSLSIDSLVYRLENIAETP